MRSSDDSYYAERREAGERYQDFVTRELQPRGIICQTLISKREQQKAENLLGLEIKFDDKLASTGNLWIETHEKSSPDRKDYVPSGILKPDNSWFYGIGDYEIFYIFGRLNLLLLLLSVTKSPGYCCQGVTYWENNRKTSLGLLMPCTFARYYALRIIEFKGQSSCGTTPFIEELLMSLREVPSSTLINGNARTHGMKLWTPNRKSDNNNQMKLL